MVPSRLEVMHYVEKFVAEKLPVFLRNPEVNWQPSDYTPDLSTDEGFEALRELRDEASRLPEDALIILVALLCFVDQHPGRRRGNRGAPDGVGRLESCLVRRREPAR